MEKQNTRTDDEFCEGCHYNTIDPIPVGFPKHLDERCVECMDMFEEEE